MKLRVEHFILAIELFALALAFVSVGYLLPWWSLVIPAGLYGFLAYRRRYAVWIPSSAAALSWVAVALIQDAEMGWRISMRIASVMGLPLGLPSGLISYVLMALLAGLLAGLAVLVGRTLREGLETLLHAAPLRGGRR